MTNDLTALSAKLSLDDLLVVAVLDLEEKGAAITFEHIVARVYELFPTRFSLRGYPQWPDSNVVNKCWLRARTDKHWMVGSVREGFRLTPDGRRHAERMRGGSVVRPQRARDADRRTKEGRLLEALKATTAYGRFMAEGAGVQLDLADVADALLAAEGTSIRTLVRNSAQFRAAAGIYEDSDVTKFLDCADEMLAARQLKERSGYAGGMMQKKTKGRSRL